MRISSLAVALMLAFSFVPDCRAEENVVEIHVAENGKSTATGKRSDPLDGLESARTAVQKIKKSNPDVPVKVIFHGGTYRFKKRVSFTAEDSGTEKGPITYMAQPGEKVYFKGSEIIDLSKIRPVDNPEILAKIPESARQKVGYINLREQGFSDIGKIPYDRSMYVADSSLEGAEIYLNDNRQTLARWPNGSDEYVQMASVVSKGGIGRNQPGGIFETEDYRLYRWTDAKDAFIVGFLGNDYSYDRVKADKFDFEKKQISLLYGTTYGLSMSYSHRWAVINLLEELDSPGEYYIDRDNGILYYYPEQTLKNAVMEMTTLGDDLIRITSLSNVNFCGITFAQTRGAAMRMYDKVQNMTISGCVFENTGRHAIWHFTNKQSRVGEKTPQAAQFRENGFENVHIENNTFCHIGETALNIICGSRDANISSGCSIRNNYVYDTGTTNRAAYAFSIKGVGIDISSNTIHEAGYGIGYHASDSRVSNNEVYNVMKHLSDGSAIYTGRNFIDRGNIVSENYLHDIKSKDKFVKTRYSHGIYLDDMDSGTEVCRNIIVDANTGVLVNCGMSNYVHDNIAVDCDEMAVKISTYNIGSQEAIDRMNLQGNAALALPGYAKYADLREDLKSGLLAQPARNTILNNVGFNADTEYTDFLKGLNKIDNNQKVEESDFADFAAGDYRLKSGNKISESLPDESFDMNNVGADLSALGEDPAKRRGFRLVYPQNGASDIDTPSVTFQWQRSIGADRYHIVVAADPELKNVVAEDYIYETNYTPGGLSENSTYYWKVWAENESARGGDVWESTGVAYMFTTAKVYARDITDIRAAVSAAQIKLAGITEGDKVGLYKEGTKKVLQEKIDAAKALLGQENSAEAEQKAILADIDNIINGDSFIVGGYVDLGDYIENPESWQESAGECMRIEPSEKKITFDTAASDVTAGCTAIEQASRVAVLKFRLKVDFAADGEREGKWLGIGIRGKLPATPVYAKGNDQYFVVFKEGVLEYQRNSGGKTEILATVQNSAIKNDEYMDIDFGVINLGNVGQLTILKINGENVYHEVDSGENMVLNMGVFQTTIAKGMVAEFAGYGGGLPDYDALVSEYTDQMTEAFCKNVEKENTDPMTILCSGSHVAYYDSKLCRIVEPVFGADENMYITLGTAAEVFGGEKNGNTLNIGGKTLQFEQNSVFADGKTTELKKPLKMQNGDYAVSLNDLTDILNKQVYFYNGESAYVADSIGIYTANLAEIMNGVLKSMKLY